MFDWLAKLFRRHPGGVPPGSHAKANGASAARRAPPHARAKESARSAVGSDTAWAPTVQMDDLGHEDFDELPHGARDEAERRSLALLQARGMSALQYVADTAARICETPIGAVTMMDGQTVWFQAAVGVDLQQLPRSQSFCTHALEGLPDVLEVPDALLDARFEHLDLVTGAPLIRFYAGAPFVTAGHVSAGAVSVADTVPRELTPVQRRTLELLARQTVMLLEARLRKEEAPAS